jgi:hypothetical protein
MPRPRTGTIIRKPTKLGISYGLRFTYRGQKVYHSIGGSWEGWTDERVEEERKFILRQVGRGEYVPPRPETAPIAAGDEVPTFQVLASIVLARKKRRVSDKTYADLKWRLDTAVDHFGEYPVDQIDVALADAFVEAKLHEREAITNAAAAGHPLLEEYTDSRTGRRHQRRRRGLSNSSINKVLVSVRRVLKEAKRRGMVEQTRSRIRSAISEANRPSGRSLRSRRSSLWWRPPESSTSSSFGSNGEISRNPLVDRTGHPARGEVRRVGDVDPTYPSRRHLDRESPA